MAADIGQRPDATAAPAGATEVIEDRPVEEHISTGVAPNQRQRDATCSIYKVPPSISGADPSAYTPKVVTIGPGHYIKDPIPDSYRDMQYCKGHALDFFKSRLPDSQILLRLLREEVETIRNCYAYEIPLNTDELAEVMMMDGCFILYLILKGRQSYYDLGGIPIRYQPVKHDLLLLENQIPFFVLKKLHDKLGIEADGRIDLVARALGFLQDVDLPRNKRTLIEPEVSVSHLLDLVHLSMLPDTCPLDRTDPGWRIPSATELREYGMAFEKRDEAQSFLDVNVRRRGLTRRTVMEIPPLALYDITLSLFRNLIAFEQCHPAAGLHVTDYVAFMACIIHTKADVRLLHLNGILVNWMTGDHDLTKFFRCLCTGAHTTDDRSYLVDVFKAVSEYKKRYLWWVRFKRGCRDKWAIIAILIGFLITVLTIFNTVFGVVVHLK